MTIEATFHHHHRRRFLGGAALALTAASWLPPGAATAQPGAAGPGSNPAFGPLRQIEAGVLDIGYVEAGPAGGNAVMLLHGWPYDIHSYAEVVPPLVAAGYRVIVPHLRGYGSTRFRSNDALRNGQQ